LTRTRLHRITVPGTTGGLLQLPAVTGDVLLASAEMLGIHTARDFSGPGECR